MQPRGYLIERLFLYVSIQGIKHNHNMIRKESRKDISLGFRVEFQAGRADEGLGDDGEGEPSGYVCMCACVSVSI